MRKIKVVVLLVRQLQHGFTKNAKVSPNLTVAHMRHMLIFKSQSVSDSFNTYSRRFAPGDAHDATRRRSKTNSSMSP